MAGYLKEISAIIPLRKDENPNAQMLQHLEQEGAETIISRENGRAKSMNIGAKQSTRKFLWFLHGDTTIPKNAAQELQSALQQNEESLHYFKLAFEGKTLTRLNAKGANFRSKFFGCPFGDQGFCIRKDLCTNLGLYDETAPYGEDHLFTWRARRNGIKLHAINAHLITSPRAYQNRWLTLTLSRQYLWLKQAIPQWVLYVRKK